MWIRVVNSVIIILCIVDRLRNRASTETCRRRSLLSALLIAADPWSLCDFCCGTHVMRARLPTCPLFECCCNSCHFLRHPFAGIHSVIFGSMVALFRVGMESREFLDLFLWDHFDWYEDLFLNRSLVFEFDAHLLAALELVTWRPSLRHSRRSSNALPPREKYWTKSSSCHGYYSNQLETWKFNLHIEWDNRIGNTAWACTDFHETSSLCM